MTPPAAAHRTILHVATERGWRGGERQVLWLARALRAMGHRNIIAARAAEPLAARAREIGIDVLECDPLFEGDPRAVLQLRRAARHADVVHAHTGHAVGLAALALLGMTTPMVVTRRVDFPLRANAATRWKYARARKVIAISRAVAEVLERSGVSRSKIIVVLDGADLSRTIAPASPETLESLGVPRDAPLVVQVAALVPHKDPLNFVRAIAAARRAVPALHALMAGDGPLRAEVERVRDQLELGGALHILGYRTDADALLASATVVTLSSREEGMGSVLLDACQLGKPIAATRAGGIPDVISDGKSGLLVPIEDSAALGAAIARLILEHDLAAHVAAGARARAPELSIERMAAKTAAVYEDVLRPISGGAA
ncbi:MAG: glycosyltransferase family 4 protein [Gemmatimonadota bacterium]|nr:glycosyltransferase family 4 protein [Gemmatimonadota bacterium]